MLALEAKAQSAERIIANARLVLEGEVLTGSVCLRDGVIHDIATGTSTSAGALDAEGDYLVPGLIDLHTDNLEKHIMPRPGVQWPAMSAALAHDALVVAGGITTVLDCVCVGATIRNPGRNELLMPTIDGIRNARRLGMLRADHLLHLRCEVTDETVVEQLGKVVDDPLVRLVSVMDHGVGNPHVKDPQGFRRRYMKRHGMNDAEFDDFMNHIVAEGETLSPANRASIAELAGKHGIPLATHDDGTAAQIEFAVDLGADIAEFPLTSAAARAARRNGLRIVAGAPNVVRGGSQSGNVAVTELATKGLLDIMASDYVPTSLILGAFGLMRDPIGFDLPRAIATVTSAPADTIRLRDRGRIAVGLRGDLLRVTMIEGAPVVRAVWSEGRLVH
jgi:alpha-D-ribose 1-methylphosphonate 5-triphosphate diphosphatase